MIKKIGKYLFVLKGLDTEVVCKKYGLTTLSNIVSVDKIHPEETTKICDLVSESTLPQIISFLSESKKIVKCKVVMINLNNENVDNICNVDCYWCRYGFETKPLSCPIRYVSHQLIKTYYSEITKDKYTIKENITSKSVKNIPFRKSPTGGEDRNVKINKNGYYETDGIFCSFNCCKAFINNNKHNSLYDDSNRLLIQMYNQIFTSKIIRIKKADDWRLLRKAGGFIDIKKFRENFNHVSYEYHGYTTDICKPIGHLWEEHLKF
jgi:hypothetical protein